MTGPGLILWVGCVSSFPQTKWMRESLTLQVSPLGMGQNLWNYHISWPINIHSPAISRYQEQTFDPPFWGWRWNLKIHSVGQNRPTQNPQAAWLCTPALPRLGAATPSSQEGGARWKDPNFSAFRNFLLWGSKVENPPIILWGSNGCFMGFFIQPTFMGSLPTNDNLILDRI